MQVQHIACRIQGFIGSGAGALLGDDTQRRPTNLKMLQFFHKHGLEATRDAYGFSRRALNRWTKAPARSGWQPGGSPAQVFHSQKAPHAQDRPQAGGQNPTAANLLTQPRQGKACRPPRPQIRSAGLEAFLGSHHPPHHCPVRHTHARIDARGRPKPVQRFCKTRKPKGLKAASMQLWATDTIERVRRPMTLHGDLH